MICPERLLYEQTLRSLQSRGAKFCVIGTFGLALHGIELPDYTLTDCDLLAENDAQNLNLIAQVLQELDWKLYLWNTPVIYPLPLNELPGKYYLRATRQNAIIDIAYENEYEQSPGVRLAGKSVGLKASPLHPLPTSCIRKRCEIHRKTRPSSKK